MDKFGKEVADKKALESNKKKANSGVRNGMFGKPAPKGSGNGWSGWYGGWFFRSLRELYYAVFILDANNISWVSAESNEFVVTYTDCHGNTRNYYPDFVIDNSCVVEVKPKSLFTSANVQAKYTAAQAHFKELGMSYIMVDCPVLPLETLENLILEKKVLLTKSTYKRYDKWRKKIAGNSVARM